MKPVIQILPDTLINQIAAGEMIERPASIVKELAENAMDAGASFIEVELEDGGIRRISVADNGSGMAPEDLPLALTRHATSKIRTFDDLIHVHSMGFRGEALASIASVATLIINSALIEGQGAQVCADGGKIGAIEPSLRSQGTTINVRDLFYNIPARRQFLKSPTTEASHCLEVCRRLALVDATRGWRVRHQGRVVLEVNALMADQEEQRWRQILGEAFFSHYRPLNETLADCRLRGVLSLPSSMESSKREMQYIFVNQRFVRDRTLLHAIREGYAEMKHDARQLSFALWLDLPAESVDVNVSPMKTEVRFRSSSHMHQLVRQSIRKALAGIPGQYAPPQFTPTPSVIDIKSSSPDQQPSSTQTSSSWRTPSQPSGFQSRPSSASISAALMLADINHSPPPLSTPSFISPKTLQDETIHPLGHALGLLHHLYILAQSDEGLVIVDIHAAHERILFEHLKRQHQIKTPIPAQTLLVPWKMRVSAEQAEAFIQHQTYFESMGLYGQIEVDSQSELESLLIIHAVPSLLPDVNYLELMDALLHDVMAYGQTQALQDHYEQVLATMACHGARRGKQNMSLADMNALLREMESIDRSGSCNHGRPSYSLLPLSSFDQFFMRGQ